MSLFDRFVGGTKARSTSSYPEAGTTLVAQLANGLHLKGWDTGVFDYTEQERAAIEYELTSFQRIADAEMGGNAVFHPEAAPQIHRHLAAKALYKFAGRDWDFTNKDQLPPEWRECVSSYLKSWVADPNPLVLYDIAEMLAVAGLKSEARQLLEVVLLFPSYASAYYGGKVDSDFVSRLISDAQERLQQLGA